MSDSLCAHEYPENPKANEEEGLTSEEIFDRVVAISDYNARGNNQLSFKRGESIRVLERTTEDWLWADIGGVLGYVPSNHVQDPAEVEEMEKWQDEEYFESYYHMRLHLEMLGDVVRTESYRKAVASNVETVRGKTVLDVGCGTGILSMFCARDGLARQVYAVEASGLAEHLAGVVKENNLDNKITIIQGRIEAVTLPEKVDIIISEWMGTFLLFEFMVESVIYARDQWLKPEGIMWPTYAQLFVFPCTAPDLYQEKVGIWKEQYGFSFSTLQPKAIKDFFSRPVIDHDLSQSSFLSEGQLIAVFDMNTLEVRELESWSCDFNFKVHTSGILHGFGSWFDVEFSMPVGEECLANSPEAVVLSTNPHSPKTHWKNAIFMLDRPIEVSTGYTIKGKVEVIRNQDFRRHMTIGFDFIISSSKGIVLSIFKEFKLWR